MTESLPADSGVDPNAADATPAEPNEPQGNEQGQAAEGETTPKEPGSKSSSLLAEGEPGTDPEPKDGDGDGDGDEASEGGDPEPADYSTLALPEGADLDESHLDNVREFAEASSLTVEQAQAVVNRDVERRAAAHQLQVETEEAWAQQVREHPELGGEHLAETLELGRQALARFAPSPEWAESILRPPEGAIKFGNEPGFVAFLRSVGKSLAESQTMVDGNQSAKTPTQEEVDRATWPASYDQMVGAYGVRSETAQ